MTLIDAPQYDASKDIRKRNIWIAVGVLIVVLGAVACAGFFTGHGWFYLNVPAEHRVSNFDPRHRPA